MTRRRALELAIVGGVVILAMHDRGFEYSYAPSAPVPFARTRHLDPFRSVGDPIETWTFVDGFGRVLQTKKDGTVHRGDDATAQDVVIVSGRRLFDPWDRVLAQWHPTEEPKADATNATFRTTADPTADPTRFDYDVVDRLLRTTLPDGTVTTHSYALAPDPGGGGALRALTTVVDAESGERRSARDVRGRITAIVEIDGATNPVTRYAYDPLGQIRRVIDAAGNVTSVGYDLAGRRTSIDNPDGGLVSFAFDAAGNMTSRVTPVLRARGEAIRYRYEHTRLVGIDYPVFSGADVTFTWGGAALRGAPGNLVGRITRVEDESGVEEREYGRLGELVEQTRTLASHTLGRGASSPETYTTRWRYDTWGRLQQMVYPDGEVLTYRYDSGGQVRSARGVKLGEEFPYVTRLEYDRFGQRVFQESGNGIRTHFDYDDDTRRLAQLEAGEFQRLSYGYDRVGNIVSLENRVPRGTPRDYGGPSSHSYSYDRLYRLTGATGRFQGGRGHDETYTLSVGYDAIHNITQKTQTHHRHTPGGAAVEQHETTYDWAYTYGSSRPHAPTHVGDRSFSFDANGNQLGWDHDRSGQRRTIVWDEEDRIRSISDNGRTTEFVYDAEGDRVFKVGAQGETAYVNNFWTVRNRTVGTKHVFVGTTRIASKLSPGEAAIAGDTDPWMVTLGRWHLHRSDSGRDHASNTTMNPHYRVGTRMPRGGLAEDNFVYFYHPDHLGSTSYVTDPDGELYEHVEYFPSGEPWVTEQTNTERLPYLFSSKELDQETGLYDFGARQYDPRVGVFLSVEPALQGAFFERDAPGGGVYFPVQLSAYAYGNHSPLVFVDPNGEWGMLVVAVAMVALMPVLMSGPDVAEGPQAAATTVLAARGGGPAAVMAATPYIMSGDDVAAAPQAVMVAGGGAQVARDLRNIAAIRRVARERQAGGSASAAPTTGRTQATPAAVEASTAAGRARQAHSATNAVRLRHQLASQEIASGHAFEKHVLNRGEFAGLGIRTRQHFARHIENIMNSPSARRSLRRDRTAFWDDATGTVVIRNPNAVDGGTAFRPVQGRRYFEELR